MNARVVPVLRAAEVEIATHITAEIVSGQTDWKYLARKHALPVLVLVALEILAYIFDRRS